MDLFERPAIMSPHHPFRKECPEWLILSHQILVICQRRVGTIRFNAKKDVFGLYQMETFLELKNSVKHLFDYHKLPPMLNDGTDVYDYLNAIAELCTLGDSANSEERSAAIFMAQIVMSRLPLDHVLVFSFDYEPDTGWYRNKEFLSARSHLVN